MQTWMKYEGHGEKFCKESMAMMETLESYDENVNLGSVHKYFGGGGWAKWRGGQKSFDLPKGGDQKVFGSKRGGGVKKVWSNWKYNEH